MAILFQPATSANYCSVEEPIKFLPSISSAFLSFGEHDHFPAKFALVRSTTSPGIERSGESSTEVLLVPAQLDQLLHRLDQQPVQLDCDSSNLLLRACCELQILSQGRRVHSHILRSGLDKYIYLLNHLITMYGNCGSVDEAEAVFDSMLHRNAVSWGAMIKVYIQQGQAKKALQLYKRMQFEGAEANKVTYITVLNACTDMANLVEGQTIHAHTVSSGVELDIMVGTALINMYSKCGDVEGAENMFHKMHVRNVVSWNALLGAYCQGGFGNEAFQLFMQMQSCGVMPSRVTFITVLNACVSQAFMIEGKMIHTFIIESGLESDDFVENALVNFYGKCGSLNDARRMFGKILKRDVVAWNAIIAIYAEHGHGREALELFQEMQSKGMKPDKVTFICISCACANLVALAEGRLIHASVVLAGFILDVVVASALVNMYGKCGLVDDAFRIFSKMHERNVVSWNSLITSCAQHKREKEALQLFDRMQLEGLKPDERTFASVISACSNLAALEDGKRIYDLVLESGFASDDGVGCALLNMFAKCGSVENAWNVFEKMHHWDVVTWTAMIAAFARHGHGAEALRLFKQMQKQDVHPNEVSFLSILSACSHAGLVDEGCAYFVSMCQEYHIKPTVHHYSCMIDLFCRSGRLEDAEIYLSKMPCQPGIIDWMSLLGACKNYGDMERGERSAEVILQLDPQCTAAYVNLSNIYAAAGKQVDAENMRKRMVKGGFME